MAIPVLEVGTPLYKTIDMLDSGIRAACHKIPGLETAMDNYIDMMAFSPHAHEYNMLAAVLAGALTACLFIGRNDMAAEKNMKKYIQ
ncbi:MAG: hypothetical protein NTU57_01315 [Candidatus Aenigmarchaeota archaeon]|nr:hypothetical protein [Candidatus Aenigmarchaeota archaeon]